ncbi:hypothetical protein CKAH01_01161 [Colletotrichum kahawae]|uniref:Uncharacterized protein n=1 Tax=Colletotrichum kahawae TaxID=34407 RepID=A0AAD9YAY9_COLKA|nr:hypothetical protein CKAH01_01161 [Colletotrichum kahawae]
MALVNFQQRGGRGARERIEGLGDGAAPHRSAPHQQRSTSTSSTSTSSRSGLRGSPNPPSPPMIIPGSPELLPDSADWARGSFCAPHSSILPPYPALPTPAKQERDTMRSTRCEKSEGIGSYAAAAAAAGCTYSRHTK